MKDTEPTLWTLALAWSWARTLPESTRTGGFFFWDNDRDGSGEGGWIYVSGYGYGTSDAINDGNSEFTEMTLSVMGDSLRIQADGTVIFADVLPTRIREAGATDVRGVWLASIPLSTGVWPRALFDWIELEGESVAGNTTAYGLDQMEQDNGQGHGRPGTTSDHRSEATMKMGMPASRRARGAPKGVGLLSIVAALSANTCETREEKEIRVGRGRELENGTRKRNEGKRNAPLFGGRASEARQPGRIRRLRQRRRGGGFTAAYKRSVVEKADACETPGEIGELLRREGLWSGLPSF